MLVLVSVVAFAAAVPFARLPLTPVQSFIPAYEAALIIIDLITVVMLFGQFSCTRSPALLALVAGYLFDALIITPHALTFPGLFAASGLLGAGPQSTAWLYMFWHAGFPLFVIAYALFNRTETPVTDPVKPAAIVASGVAVCALVAALTGLATAGQSWLPAIMVGSGYTAAMKFVVGATWLFSISALVILYRGRRRSILDLWLMVVMCAWVFDIALSAVFNGGRFDLGFYAGRLYGLLATSFVLIALLVEAAGLHKRLAAAKSLVDSYARDLEERVRERTAELDRSNQSLKAEIAERRQAEAEAQRARKSLDVVIESIPAMLIVKSAKDGRCTLINHAGEVLLGRNRREIIGKSAREVLAGPEADEIELHDAAVLAANGAPTAHEHALTSCTQGLRHLRTRRVLLPDARGEPAYLLAFSEDLTEQRQVEEQLHQAQKMEALGQLTGGLAHDFNNHLAIIIGNLDLLREMKPGDGPETELLQDALDAALNGSELTRRLLAFARRAPLRPERIDVNQLIGNSTRLLSRTLGEGIEIRLNLDAAVPPIIADPAQLETAIANLANNARDAMLQGGQLVFTTGRRELDEDYAAAHAEVTAGTYVMIEVSDTGHGMPPEVASRVFEPFYTTKGPGKGTGLGLSMVFGFLKQSGGHINVYSEPSRGTTFRLYLQPAEAATRVSEDAAASLPLSGSGEMVLVVEDNAKLRHVLIRQLTELNYRIVEAENAQAALDLLDSGVKVDLLVSDIVMPGEIDGLGLAREFTVRNPGARVLLTSGFPGARLVDAAGLSADVRLLSKPYRKSDLARTLREVLDERVPVGSFDAALS
jgi:PAS domain S-box-containing protein